MLSTAKSANVWQVVQLFGPPTYPAMQLIQKLNL